MAGFNLFVGNRMEALPAQRADILREPLSDPLRNDVGLFLPDPERDDELFIRAISGRITRSSGLRDVLWKGDQNDPIHLDN